MFIKPSTAVTIGTVDPYGLQGREAHPPINEDHRTSPCNGQVAYIVDYVGWWNEDDHSMVGEDGDDREGIHAAAPEGDDTTHMYRALVPGLGIYEFADYEFAA